MRRRRRLPDPAWPLYRAPRGTQVPEALATGLPRCGYVVVALGGDIDAGLVSFVARMAARRDCPMVVMADRLDRDATWLSSHEVVALDRDLVEFLVPRRDGALVLLLQDGCIADAAAGPERFAAPLREHAPERRGAIAGDWVAVAEHAL